MFRHMNLPSILFIVDTPGWAFDRWTKELSEELIHLGLRSTRCFRNTIPLRITDDYIYVCWWPDIKLISSNLKPEQRILCRVTDMLTWNKSAPIVWQERFKKIIPKVHTFIASSKEISE